MEMVISAAELRKALYDIEAAEKNGFMFCLAVLKLDSAGPSISDCRVRYSDMIEKAHPTDGSLDWGRFQGVTQRYMFRKGKIVPQKKTRKGK